MKLKITLLAVFVAMIYSCASKSSIPTEVVKEKILTPELAEGKSLYENSCGRCHGLYEPSDYNAEQWKPIVERMSKKARLNETDGMKIYNYLTVK